MKRFEAYDSSDMTLRDNGEYCLHSDHLADKEQAIAALQAKLDAAVWSLERIATGLPALHEGNFVTMHYDCDGNELGFEHHDPVAIIQSIYGVAESALAQIKGDV